MTKKFDDLIEIADEIDLQSSSTVQDLIDTITNIGHSDNVYARYDEFLGLDGDISSELKNMTIDDATDEYDNLTEQQQRQYNRIVEVANEVIPLSNEELSDDEREEFEQEQEDWDSYIENINKD